MSFTNPEFWMKHLFDYIKCPKNVTIPVDDVTVWSNHPNFRWVYNKMKLCEIQNIEYGPHGVLPSLFPVFSKPIANLWGMGMGSDIIYNEDELYEKYKPGHFWMELLEGHHYSVDVVLIDSWPIWWTHSIGFKGTQGTFDYWSVYEHNQRPLMNLFDLNFFTYFPNFTGHMNLEIIDNKIIECHPRLSTQFIPFYGQSWLKEIINLYQNKKFNLNIIKSFHGYSIPVFIDNTIDIFTNKIYFNINQFLTYHLNENEYIIDIQNCIDITEQEINGRSNPPSFNRIAVINSTNLQVGLEIRQELMDLIEKT